MFDFSLRNDHSLRRRRPLALRWHYIRTAVFPLDVCSLAEGAALPSPPFPSRPVLSLPFPSRPFPFQSPAPPFIALLSCSAGWLARSGRGEERARLASRLAP